MSCSAAGSDSLQLLNKGLFGPCQQLVSGHLALERLCRDAMGSNHPAREAILQGAPLEVVKALTPYADRASWQNATGGLMDSSTLQQVLAGFSCHSGKTLAGKCIVLFSIGTTLA
jgi:hypothetical protein